jgi:hypothetical protein
MAVNGRSEIRPASDPWRGRQPHYEKLLTDGSGHFFMVTRLPSRATVRVPLGRLDSRRLPRQ